jgi:tetratricopeptide (TPR) repeat protein
MHEARGDLAQAEAYARQALVADPSSAAAHRSLGRVLAAQGNVEAALTSYRTAMPLDPRQFGTYDDWIRLHVDRVGRWRIKDRLQTALDEIAQSQPDALWGQVALALGKRALEGNTGQVVSLLEEASSRDPTFSELYRELALAHEAQGNGRAAQAAWDRYLVATCQGAPDADTAHAHIDWLQQTWIDQPAHGADVSGQVAIIGTATLAEGFQFYKLEYASASGPEQWTAIGDAVDDPVEHGLLAAWSTSGLPAGEYWLRLTVVDIDGNHSPYDQVTIRVVAD